MSSGRNYAARAREMNAPVPKNPLVFLKAPNAYLPDGTQIHLPEFSKNVHHEVELVVIIGKDLDECTEAEAYNAVAGYAQWESILPCEMFKQQQRQKGTVDP
jgi:2-keto-4-pentenoate hydratase/2-oxohepta-3-ene-1,7-dioic acid hydratase in catechol pathway